MKRFLVICLAVLITLLVGCNDAKPSTTKKPTTDNSEIQTSSDDKPEDEVSSDSNNISNNTSSESSSNSLNSSSTSSDSSSNNESSVLDKGIQEIIPTGNTANLMNPQIGGSDEQADALRNKILNAKDTLKINGKKYYISPNGSLDNDGLSPETPWSTDALIVYGYEFKSGDAVLFERGKVYRIVSSIPLVSGVTYAAYGTGNKPAIYASQKNYAQDGLWFPSKKENIWRLDFTAGEVGHIVFNHGESMGVMRDGLADLKNTGEFYHNQLEGYLYLYCDKGYPQDVYKDIEIGAEVGIMGGSSLQGVTIDNLAFKYTGSHSINITNSKDITIQNCEFGWIGGCYMTEAGSVERYGNAIQFWDKAENITVKNNWIYQIYDAGLTFQSRSDVKYSNINFTDNLIEYCNYSIEFFVGEDQNDVKGEYKNITMANNIMRFAGYGFGFNRNYVHGTAHIVGWQYAVPNTTNFKIQNNIFDCSARALVCWGWTAEQKQPGLIISGNTFYQKKLNFPMPDNYISGYVEYAAMSFGVSGNNFVVTTAKNQKELEAAVKIFDKSPKAVKWLDK